MEAYVEDMTIQSKKEARHQLTYAKHWGPPKTCDEA